MEENMNTTNVKDIEKYLEIISKKREVEDLHPHLGHLFNKLTGIKNVSHSHGPNELGTDFILEKYDETIEKTIYIGVIVKNKPISQPMVANIKEQINECLMPRTIDNGTQKIRINEIWMLANGNVSQNAQEKIYDNRMSTIKILDRKKIAQLMVKHGHTLKDNLPASVLTCLDKQKNMVEQLNQKSIAYRITGIQTSIQQNVSKVERLQYRDKSRSTRKKSREDKNIESVIREENNILICGGPGAGKSKMLERIITHYSSIIEYKKSKLLPVFSTCQEIKDKYCNSVIKLLDRFIINNELSDVVDCSYVIIIDGIDESDMSQEERVEIIKKWRKEIMEGSKAKKLIVAGREYMNEAITGMSTYRVLALSPTQIIKAVKESLAHLDTANRIVSDLARSSIFPTLPRIPLATIILISLLKDNDGIDEIPANLTELFSKYVECSLGRWDNNINDRIMQRRYDAAKNVLIKISQYMIDNKIPIISEEEAKDFFINYFHERNLGIKADDTFSWLVKRSDLIYLHNGRFGFRHRTIMEFFYANNFSESDLDRLGGGIYDTQWTTIVFFFVGLKKDCPALLNKISAITPSQEYGIYMKSANIANILLSGYATPYKNITKILSKTFVEVADYLESIISGKREPILFGEVTTMQLLFFFRIIMDYEYARPFFQQAIDDALIETEEDKSLNTSVKALALFLLNMPYRTLGGDDVFLSMIEKIKMPDYIRLAIDHETDIDKKISAPVKKYKKMINKTLYAKGKGEMILPYYSKKLSLIHKKIEGKES